MSKRILIISIIIVAVTTAGITAYYTYRPNAIRVDKFRQWMKSPASHPDWKLVAGSQCGSAPFLFPTDGMAGFLWGDLMGKLHRHQGIDIFAGTDVNVTPVISVYPGYLTRLDSWKSSLIIRIPDDPLKPGRQIWTYYTHIADPDGNSLIAADFPPGTSEMFVQAGTLLGYQGNYTGNAANPSGVHLHFSIVLDDGKGDFRNELDIRNTLDPSPYLGLPLNARASDGEVILCPERGAAE